ncbi:MAG: chemotaxis protein CheR [Blastopirellula sp.]|nr:MAG: chemotaxis protein CheR [Blastopirellula sp.]
MTPEELDLVCDLVHDLCGIALDNSKDYLIESRLSRLLDQVQTPTYTDLVRHARGPQGLSLQKEIINSITTQETLFFRDSNPFDAVRFKALPELIDEKSKSFNPKRLRIWSAACSTGQEPYSLAMTLIETIPDIHSWDVSITATDISNEALAKASRGWFPEHEVARGLDQTRRTRFFTPEKDGWKIKDEVRYLLNFQPFNLLKDFSHVGQFDIIFCRNVVIYFNPEDRKRAYLGLTNQLAPNGFLFVGASESLIDLGDRFQPQHHCNTVYYQPNRVLPEFVIANKVKTESGI